jgi:hypothetical protein
VQQQVTEQTLSASTFFDEDATEFLHAWSRRFLRGLRAAREIATVMLIGGAVLPGVVVFRVPVVA